MERAPETFTIGKSGLNINIDVAFFLCKAAEFKAIELEDDPPTTDLPKRVTLADNAQIALVRVGTVSLCLNNNKRAGRNDLEKDTSPMFHGS